MELDFRRTKTEHWHGHFPGARSSEPDRQRINLSSKRINYDHHDAGSSAPSLDHEVVTSKVRSRLFLAVTINSPTFTDALSDHCAETSFFRRHQLGSGRR